MTLPVLHRNDGGLPLPAHLQDSLRINWHLTKWCNYSCQYCPVLVFRQRSATGQRQEHSFDYHPVEDWLEAIGRFSHRHIHLKITGGEPFLDRKNFRVLLAGLAGMKHIRVGIDTNGYWEPAWFEGLDTSGVFLNVTFHPTQSDFAGFFRRVKAIRDAGFTITMVNYVVAPENMDSFEAAFAQLDREGFTVNVSVMIQTGLYFTRTERSERELDLLVRHNTPLDLHFKLLQPQTKGRPCFYPAMTYYLQYDGKIRVSCMDREQDLFTDGIPELPRTSVACPHDQCEGCADMYRALADEPRLTQPFNLYTLEDFSREFSEYRRSQKVDDPEFRRTAVAYWREQVESKRQNAASSLLPVMPAPAAEPPADPIFGYVDARDGRFFIEARSRDRVCVSGWVASGRHGTPVRELKLKIQGQELGVVREFSARPDVAVHFGRPNLLHSGWQALVYLPALKPGQYELMVEVTDRDGVSGTLAPWPVRIVA
jgi:organic radical activating enzyme